MTDGIHIRFGRPREDPGGFGNSGSHTKDERRAEDQDSTRNSHFDGWRLWIRYCDIEGNASNRWVRIYRIESRPNADYLVGHCELRKATRSFRIDRIVEIADKDGELHEPADFFKPYISPVQLRSSGPDRSRPFGKALKIIDMIGDDLKILAFIAEADGSFGNREADVLTKYAMYRAAEAGLELNKSDSVDLRKWMKMQNPDELTIRSSIRRIASRRTMTFDDLWDLANIVVEVDGKIKKSEQAALNELRSTLESEFNAACPR